jgi:multiple sugar transport system permease protein/raffinose/stachyose/melibiose transport system permease protein
MTTRIEKAKRAIPYAVLILFAIPTLFPIYAMLNIGVKDFFQYTNRPLVPTFPFHFENFKVAWDFMARSFLNNVVIISTSTVAVLLFASLTAYALSRHEFAGKKFIFYLVLYVMAIPATVIIVPSFLLVVNLGILNTYWAVILPYAAHQSLVIIVMYTSFGQLNESMFESARMDGAGHLIIYSRIILPLSKPIISAMAIFEVWWHWNDYTWPSLVLSSPRILTVALQLVTFIDGMFLPEPGQQMAANLITSIPLMLIFFVSMRTFIRGITSGAMKL